MHNTGRLINLIDALGRMKLARFLLAAALLHLSVVVTINVIAQSGLLPQTFDESGVGISFAVDSAEYRLYVIKLVRVWEREGIVAWAKESVPFHVRLYSICFAVFAPVLGFSTLSVEPLNLFYYLLMLTLVFAVGREVFERRTAMLAASAVAVWPSFLLHTTQLLRDPLFVSAMLALVLVCALFLTRRFSWQRGLIAGCAGGAAANVIWLIRSQMWEVMLGIVLLTLGLIVVKHIRERRFMAGALLGCGLLVVLVVSLPRVARELNLYSYPADMGLAQQSSQKGKVELVRGRTLPPGSGLPARISYMRYGFVTSYPGAGSNIDTDVQFESMGDILRYLPRAVMIGLFAPFPRMWFETGPQLGLMGRVVSGLETLLMYVMEMLAVVCLWQRRKVWTVWLLTGTALVGMGALGLVVANIATLYRMRYVFWILVLIQGMHGALLLLTRASEKKKETA